MLRSQSPPRCGAQQDEQHGNREGTTLVGQPRGVNVDAEFRRQPFRDDSRRRNQARC